MQIYILGADVVTLQPWPFDHAEINFKILAEAPAALGRVDTGGPDSTSRLGNWSRISGTVECTEKHDELMTPLSGHCRLQDQLIDKSHELSAGLSLAIPDRNHITREFIHEVTKVLF